MPKLSLFLIIFLTLTLCLADQIQADPSPGTVLQIEDLKVPVVIKAKKLEEKESTLILSDLELNFPDLKAQIAELKLKMPLNVLNALLNSTPIPMGEEHFDQISLEDVKLLDPEGMALNLKQISLTNGSISSALLQDLGKGQIKDPLAFLKNLKYQKFNISKVNLDIDDLKINIGSFSLLKEEGSLPEHFAQVLLENLDLQGDGFKLQNQKIALSNVNIPLPLESENGKPSTYELIDKAENNEDLMEACFFTERPIFSKLVLEKPVLEAENLYLKPEAIQFEVKGSNQLELFIKTMRLEGLNQMIPKVPAKITGDLTLNSQFKLGELVNSANLILPNWWNLTAKANTNLTNNTLSDIKLELSDLGGLAWLALNYSNQYQVEEDINQAMEGLSKDD
ncbi:MAG: hypothetical protein IJU40_08610, partial [Desulfovibrionaceae bacterium]|nr:hypothetical protein [Desulfovibrionaceae bacterium]